MIFHEAPKKKHMSFFLEAVASAIMGAELEREVRPYDHTGAACGGVSHAAPASGIPFSGPPDETPASPLSRRRRGGGAARPPLR